MAEQPQIKYFLGANSPTGFFSLYDQLIHPASASAIYILKGGPGCGKSSLIRRVGCAAEKAGFATEYILCSGDLTSLDGIVIPALGTAIVDGTAPHVVEPTCPGVVERYVNLGSCYNTPALVPLRREITACLSAGSDCYTRAYRCLGAAAEIRENMRSILLTDTLKSRFVKRANGILGREIRRRGDTIGRVKQCFLGAVTHGGTQCLFDTADAQCRKIYELWDSYGLSDVMLIGLLTGAIESGYDVVACMDPMSPARLEHLLIPELSLGFVTSNPTQEYSGRPYRRIRIDSMADKELVRHSRPRLRFGSKVSGALVGEAVESLAQAKELHDKLEALYNPHVDFTRVYRIADELSAEILSGKL